MRNRVVKYLAGYTLMFIAGCTSRSAIDMAFCMVMDVLASERKGEA